VPLRSMARPPLGESPGRLISATSYSIYAVSWHEWRLLYPHFLSSPYTSTLPRVPTNTVPSITVGIANRTVIPARSRPLFCSLLFSSFVTSVISSHKNEASSDEANASHNLCGNTRWVEDDVPVCQNIGETVFRNKQEERSPVRWGCRIPCP